jgi:hypothetical protein
MDTQQQTDMVARLHTKLTEYDLHVLCDITGSMDDPNSAKDPTGPTRWAYAQETLRECCRLACAIDDDGITLGFFGGNKYPIYENVTNDKVNEILNKQVIGGGTYLAPALNQLFRKIGGGKKDLCLVFLDGEVNDKPQVEAELIAQANRQAADNECTVLFIQVGDDSAARAWLKTLDDGLEKKGAKFDIVDAKTLDEVAQYPSFEELLANAIVD